MATKHAAGIGESDSGSKQENLEDQKMMYVHVAVPNYDMEPVGPEGVMQFEAAMFDRQNRRGWRKLMRGLDATEWASYDARHSLNYETDWGFAQYLANR